MAASQPRSEAQRERARDLRLQRLFGITAEEYDRVLVHQGGKCAICRRPPASTRLAVDHDHKTGLSRGLVCWSCNAGLQKFRDDPETVARAARYLLDPPITAVLGEERFGRTGRVTNKRRRKRNGRG